MRIASEQEIVSLIEKAARAKGGGVVATDGDGTLWSGDVGEDSFQSFIARGRIDASAHEAMKREAASHGVDESGDAAALAQRIFDRYADGTFPEERACELMAWCYAGWRMNDVRAFMREVVAARALATRLHAELGRVLDAVRAMKLELFLVSASPRAIVEEGARIVGIDAAHVLAADPIVEAGEVRPDVHRPIPYGPGKATHLARAIGDRPLLAAFGDNRFDIAMLQAAEVPVAIRPKARLRERASEVPKLLELARPAS
jgi:phosphoserine phosphatase